MDFFKSERMSTFKSYRSQMKQLIEAFEEELYDLYYSDESTDVIVGPAKHIKVDKSPYHALSPEFALLNILRTAKIVTFYDDFKLILCEVVDEAGDKYVWIDVKTVLKHISLIDKEDTIQSKKSTARMRKVDERAKETPSELVESLVVNVRGLYNRDIDAIFVPVCDLVNYCSPYRENLLKFMSKDLINGDHEGWIYYNHAINDDTGRVTDVKGGRAKDLKCRLCNYNSTYGKNKKHIITMKKIYTSERYKAEGIWKDLVKKNQQKIPNIIIDNEWLKLSDDFDESNKQMDAIEKLWEEYVKLLKDKKLLIEPTSEESQNEEDAESNQ